MVQSWVALLLLAAALPATADTAVGRIYPSVSIVSDYRYNGVSYSHGEPAWQGYVHWQQPDGYFAGVFASGVEFNDPSRTSYELDVYAGRKLRRDAWEVTLETLYSSFPEKDFPGPTYDFLQLKSQVRATFGRYSVGALATWTPQASFGTGPAWRAAVDGRWSVRRGVTLSGAVGRRWIELGNDRTYWDLGATFASPHLSLDVRYVATNLSPSRCGFDRDACGAAVVVGLTWTPPSLGL